MAIKLSAVVTVGVSDVRGVDPRCNMRNTQSLMFETALFRAIEDAKDDIKIFSAKKNLF